MPRETPRPPVPSHSLSFLPPSSALSLARSRAELIAAVHRSRSHRLPLASPTRAEAPPRPPRPLHQATRSRTRCNVATIAVPVAGHQSSPPSIRDVWRAPEPTDLLRRLPVSSSSPLFARPLRSRPLASCPAKPELRPPLTSSPPSLQPLELPPECTIVLRTFPRARCLPQLALLCPLVVACVSPELRRPQPKIGRASCRERV